MGSKLEDEDDASVPPKRRASHTASYWKSLKALIKPLMKNAKRPFAYFDTLQDPVPPGPSLGGGVAFPARDPVSGPIPSLSIEGVGEVSLPLSSQQAQALAATGEPAPYSVGTAQTRRPIIQIAASKVHMDGTWDKTLADIKEKALANLAFKWQAPTKALVNLYKLLLYPPGGHFAAHRDTEKEPGMFATLIVQLPAGHVGGALHIRHEGKEVLWATQFDSDTRIQYCAYRAGCEHQLSPVTAGWRMVLVYNLVDDRASVPQAGPSPSLALAKAVQEWEADTSADKPTRMGVLLGYKYPRKKLSFAKLQGCDKAMAGLLMSCDRLDVHLVLMERYVEGRVENRASNRDRRGYMCDDDSSSEEQSYSETERSPYELQGSHYRDESDSDDTHSDDYENEDADYVEEKQEDSVHASCWASPAGPAKYDYPSINNRELINAKKIFSHGDKATLEKYAGYRGDSDATQEYWYHKAVLVAWPRSMRGQVAKSVGLPALLDLLEQTLQDASWWRGGGHLQPAQPEPEQQQQPEQPQAGQSQQSTPASRGGVKRDTAAQEPDASCHVSLTVGTVTRSAAKRHKAIVVKPSAGAAAAHQTRANAADCTQPAASQQEELSRHTPQQPHGSGTVPPAASTATATATQKACTQQGDNELQAEEEQHTRKLQALTQLVTAIQEASAEKKVFEKRHLRMYSVEGDTALIVRTAELLLQTEYEGVDLQVVHASVISLLSAVGKLRWAIKNYDMCDMLAVLASRLSCPEVDQALISTVQASMKESVSETYFKYLRKHAFLPKHLAQPLTATAAVAAPGAFRHLHGAYASNFQVAQPALAALLQSPRIVTAVERGGVLTPYLAGLVGMRIRYLESQLKGDPGQFTWHMTNADHQIPEVQAFLKGPETSKVFTGLSMVAALRHGADGRYTSYSFKSEVAKDGLSVTVTKTRAYYDRVVNAYLNRVVPVYKELDRLDDMMQKLVLKLLYMR